MITKTAAPTKVTFTAAEAMVKDAKAGAYEVLIINEGQGSSGYYPADVIKQAAEDKIFGAGLHVYLDHPGEEESWDRPERTVRDLAAVFTEDATWSDEHQGLLAPMQVLEHMRPLVEAISPYVGMSIRAWVEAESKEIDGVPQTVMTKFTGAESVDIVTHAGRGGAILRALESAGIKNFPASPVREHKEVVMPEQLTEATAKSLAEALTGLTAVLNAEAQARVAASKKAEEEEIDPVDLAVSLGTALAESSLTRSQYDRVKRSIKAGVSVEEAIKEEEEYAAKILEESKAGVSTSDIPPTTVGRVVESGSTYVPAVEAEQKSWQHILDGMTAVKV